MNLETKIDQRLWEAIEASLEKRSYTGAILDSLHFLSDLIRQKTGLDGDGAPLVGSAFGGANPKLKVNRFQTESEKNIQKGIEQILRGVYQAIRNPRSHGKYTDNQEEAEAITLFVNWLIKIIDQFRSPFTLNDFLGRVFDRDFVSLDRYAQLLVAQIPTTQRVDTLLEVYRRRDDGDGKKLAYFCRALCALLTEEEKRRMAEHISEELTSTDSESTIRLTIQCFPSDWWILYKEDARLRIENKLIQSVRDGRYHKKEDRVRGGSLGTWTVSIVDRMILRRELSVAISDLLSGEDSERKDYVFTYLFYILTKLEDRPNHLLKGAIVAGLSAGDKRFHENLSMLMRNRNNSTWGEIFKEQMADFEEKTGYDDLDDEIPF